jgi:hypothetical protein
MTQEEIQRLLGGYATNTLTESERAALFEAALEDQALFDALHNEDALREVLTDPVSREQVRQALQPARRVSWMRRPWLIGTASVAAAAVVAVAILIAERKPVRRAPALQIASSQLAQNPAQIAQNPAEPKPIAPKPAAPRSRKRAPPVPAPATADAIREEAPSSQLAASPSGGLVGAIGGAPAAPRPPLRKQELTAGIAANAPLYNGPLVRYSVQRSGPSGDAIRIEVVSQLAGNLALYRMGAAGQWQRVFPVNAAQIPIAANTAYQIPENPIAIGGNQDKLRLVIEPAEAATSSLANDRLSTGQLAEPRAKAMVTKSVAPMPLVVEIAIGPN